MIGNVKPEMMEFRDGDLSRRHRRWGVGCPAVDIDFPLIEYNWGEPAAIVEYKFAGAEGRSVDFDNPSMRALASLANAAKIPFIVALYTREPWTFRVFRGNEYAERIYREDGRLMTEREFVESLYFIRNGSLATVEENLLDNLDNWMAA